MFDRSVALVRLTPILYRLVSETGAVFGHVVQSQIPPGRKQTMLLRTPKSP